MVKLLSKLSKSRELVSYFLVASSGVVIQLIVSSITQNFFGFSFENSIIAGYIVAFVVGFFLTKVFAFDKRHSNNSGREAIKFVIVSIVSGIITVKGAYYGRYFLTELGIFKKDYLIFNKRIDIIELVSHFFGMGLSFIVNFLSHKNFTFQSTGLYSKFLTFFKRKS